MESTAGRDKIARTIQYTAKFLGWWVAVNGRADLSKRLNTLENSTSTGRKLFRLAKFLNNFSNAKKSYHENTDPVVQLTSVIGEVSLGLWLIFDNIVWAGKTGVTTADVTKISRKANQFWLLAMISAIIKNAYLLQQTQISINNTTKYDALVSLRQRQFSFLLDLVRNMFDLTIPSTALSKELAARLPSGVVGLCGMISSFIGLYQVWVKVK